MYLTLTPNISVLINDTVGDIKVSMNRSLNEDQKYRAKVMGKLKTMF